MKNFNEMTDIELADAVIEAICELGARGVDAGAHLDVEGEQRTTFEEGMDWLVDIRDSGPEQL